MKNYVRLRFDGKEICLKLVRNWNGWLCFGGVMENEIVRWVLSYIVFRIYKFVNL